MICTLLVLALAFVYLLGFLFSYGMLFLSHLAEEFTDSPTFSGNFIFYPLSCFATFCNYLVLSFELMNNAVPWSQTVSQKKDSECKMFFSGLQSCFWSKIRYDGAWTFLTVFKIFPCKFLNSECLLWLFGMSHTHTSLVQCTLSSFLLRLGGWSDYYPVLLTE